MPAASTLSPHPVKRTNPGPHSTGPATMPRPIRRVFTGHNAQGKAVFVSDGPAPAVYDRGPGATAVTELWETAATPASNAGNTDPTVGGVQQRLPPPKNGSKFRVVEYPPDSKRVAA